MADASSEIPPSCPLCGQSCQRQELYLEQQYNAIGRPISPTDHEKGVLITCDHCGQFAVSEGDLPGLGDDAECAKRSGQRRIPAGLRRKLSALVAEHRTRGLSTLWLQFRKKEYWPLVRLVSGIQERIELAGVYYEDLLKRWPATVAEKLNRSLMNLAMLSPTAGHVIELPSDDLGVWFAENEGEALFMFASLKELGLIKDIGSTRGSRRITVTAEGWNRYDGLTRGRSNPEHPVFVAMWFGGDAPQTRAEMDDLYNQIEATLKGIGYRATRVDLAPHNDFIMDKIISDIQEAPFLVADFTCHRHGVYFEAGYARGLGVPVIHTCKQADFENAHFDIKQINTIRWTQPGDVVEPLKHRVLATLGRGPHEP